MAKRANGEGTIRKRSDGRWEGRYYDPINDKQQSIYGKTQKEVREKLSQVTVAKDIGSFVSRTDLTVDEWFNSYIATYKVGYIKPQSVAHIKQIYRTHIYPYIGARKIHTICSEDIIEILRQESVNCNITTVQHIRGNMFSLFSQAAKSKIISMNPVSNIKVPKNENPIRTKRELSQDELYWFLRGVYEYRYSYFLYFCLLMTTGMRKNEALALKWNNIDDDFQWLRVDATAVYYFEDHKTVRSEGTPKSATSIRELPIHECVAEGLRKQKAKAIFLAEQFNRKFSNDDYIFVTNNDNEPINQSRISSCIRSVKAYIFNEYNINIGDFSPHYFRHTFASRCIRNKVPLETLRQLMGHSDYDMILKYAHANSEDKKEAIKNIFP